MHSSGDLGDAYDSLFKSKVFRSELVMQEFDSIVKEVMGLSQMSTRFPDFDLSGKQMYLDKVGGWKNNTIAWAGRPLSVHPRWPKLRIPCMLLAAIRPHLFNEGGGSRGGVQSTIAHTSGTGGRGQHWQGSGVALQEQTGGGSGPRAAGGEERGNRRAGFLRTCPRLLNTVLAHNPGQATQPSLGPCGTQMEDACGRYEIFIKRLELADDPNAKAYLTATNAQMLEGGCTIHQMFTG